MINADIVEVTDEDGYIYRFKPMAFGQHCYVCRKTVTGREQIGDDFMVRGEGGVVLPDRIVSFSLIVEILGKGAKVGKRCSKEHAARFWQRPRDKKKVGPPRARHLPDVLQIGDLVKIPKFNRFTRHPGIKRFPGSDCIYFIEEGVPEAIWKEEGWQQRDGTQEIQVT